MTLESISPDRLQAHLRHDIEATVRDVRKLIQNCAPKPRVSFFSLAVIAGASLLVGAGLELSRRHHAHDHLNL